MSKRGGSSPGGGTKQVNKEQTASSTPSGYTWNQFMTMSQNERYRVIEDIIKSDVTVPNYLDSSDTTKVMYALGMTGKPQILDDTEFDALPGKALYRTVNGNRYLNSREILDQIAMGDYTRLSDSGGSAYGRGIYFADSLGESLSYGWGSDTGVMRIKPSSGAKIVADDKIKMRFIPTNAREDEISLNALAQGYSGYYNKSSGYYVILDRSKIAVSKTYKSRPKGRYSFYIDWNEL